MNRITILKRTDKDWTERNEAFEEFYTRLRNGTPRNFQATPP